jgi:hypothetical protein
MTDTAPAIPGPILPPPPRRSHGCLWGCLGAALLAIIVIGGSVGYFGWYLYSGFKSDATLQTVMHVVSGDQVAHAVLGDNITITNLESSSVNADLSGKTNSYVAHLKGSKAEGTLAVTVVTTHGGKPAITTLLLTGPDGHQYNLQTGGEGAVPGPTNIDHKSGNGGDQGGDTGQGQPRSGDTGPPPDNGNGSGDDNGGDVGQGGSHGDQGDGDGDNSGNGSGNDDGGQDGGQDGGGNAHPHNNNGNQPI